jgi:CRISPR-associated endonuclease/helicase Cas3
MSRGLNRSERLKEMERLYVQRGYTDIEMADRLGVTRTTAYKDRILLETKIPLTKDANGRWRIDRSRYISEIRLDLYEALVLYLSRRATCSPTITPWRGLRSRSTAGTSPSSSATV